MANIASTIKDTISISLFNRGLAGKIFDEVNEARLLAIATERMEQFSPACVISADDLYKELGITKDDLDTVGEVEIE